MTTFIKIDVRFEILWDFKFKKNIYGSSNFLKI